MLYSINSLKNKDNWRKLMGKNKIQFQRGMSFGEFIEIYGTEEQCRNEVAKMRWTDGFVCPKCGGKSYCGLKSRKIFQCNRCHHQTSVITSTIFHSTKLPLTKWFLAIYLLTQSKKGISTVELARHLGVSQNTGWMVKHKLMQVMLERDKDRKLNGRIEVDDAYLGGEKRNGKRGRGSENKTPFIAAVETSVEGHPKRIKLQMLSGFRKKEISRWAKANLESGSSVITDGLGCFNALTEAGCNHEAIIVGSNRKSVDIPSFSWVNTVLGNLKNSITGTYHSTSSKHIPRYLAEFQYRFNRRFELKGIMKRLIYASVRTPPMPGRLLTMAEHAW